MRLYLYKSRWLWSVLIGSYLLLTAGTCVAQYARENALLNGSFEIRDEDRPSEATHWDRSFISAGFAYDPSYAGVTYRRSSNDRGSIYQRVTLQAGVEYTLTFQARKSPDKPGAGANLSFFLGKDDNNDGWWEYRDQIATQTLTDEGWWQTYFVTFTPEGNHTHFVVEAIQGQSLSESQSAHIDNIRITGGPPFTCIDLAGTNGGRSCASDDCEDGVNLSYERNGLSTWNSEDKLDFSEKYTLNVPFEQVEWYVKDKLTQQFRKVEDPTNFYFGAMGPDRDEWGVVTIQPFYQNSEGGLCAMEPTTLEVVDRGIYFRNAEGQLQRWKEELYNENPRLYEGFFDPDKPTLIHAHGWQGGANKRHAENNSDERGRLIEGAENPEDVAQHWFDEGWNVAIYFWTQFAEHDDEEGLFPANTAEKTYGNDPQWMREDGSLTTEQVSNMPVGQDFANQVINLRTITGNTAEMRWSGHSLGAILITWASIFMEGTNNQAHQPSRLVYLDPAWEPGLFKMWEIDLLPRIDAFPVVEWYQTSPYNIFLGQSLGGQLITEVISNFSVPNGDEIYNAAIQNSAYVRTHPLWQEGYPTGGDFLHASARRHYFSSIKDDRQPTVLERSEVFETPPPVTFYCEDNAIEADPEYFQFFVDNSASPWPINPANLYDSFEYIGRDGRETQKVACFYPEGTANGPSAKATLEELKEWRGYPLSQVRGITTINTNDDGYAIQKFDTEFHRDRTVEADESLDARRCNRVIFEPGFHAKKGSQVVAATEYNCQDAVCPANCEDPIFNDGARLATTAEETANSVAPSLEETLEAEPSTFKAYPNPTKDELIVEIPQRHQTVRVELYSVQGVKQLEALAEASEGDNKVSFNLDGLPAGLYILTVHDAQGQHLYATRIVKE